MKTKAGLVLLLISAFALPLATLKIAAQAAARAASGRPQGPCDVYAAANTPCVAAHSSTRALYAGYNGPLYRVLRQSDGKTLDIGVVQPNATDGGGYADAAAQDAFCANTTCWITALYDQSGKANHLVQAPRGGFSGPAMGGFNNIPIADMAPVTVMGHKVYGVFIEPGMGLRLNDTKGTAVDDQAEGQYWVISGSHYNNRCCFDYGNAETDSRDDGDGTMETTYYGNSAGWYHGAGEGPWVMTDQENNLVGCVNPSPTDKYCAGLPAINWRFVTAMADGEAHHWRSMGGDAQGGELHVMFDGSRVINDRKSYDPMRKQGAILLGNGGDNSNGSQGTFFEGALTAAGTFPSKETNQQVQANVVAAHYDGPRVRLAPASATVTPPGLQTFSPGSAQDTTVTFTNTTGAPVSGVTLGLSLPAGWTSTIAGVSASSQTVPMAVPVGATASVTFMITSGPAAFNGDLLARAAWKDRTGQTQAEVAREKVRNVSPVKINEFAVGSGPARNPTDSFIELYNAGDAAVDISRWSLTQHATMWPIFSAIEIPAGTSLAPKGFYLLALSNSGLAVPARKGDTVIHVRSTAGLKAGDTIEVGTGPVAETRQIASLGTAASPGTTVWQPLPEGPVVTVPVGSSSVPVANTTGFEIGQKIGLGYGATYPAVARSVESYEVVTVTAVGKAGTQAYLAADAKPGDTNLKVSAVANISVGDKIRLDIDSVGHGIETVTVTKVGTACTGRPSAGRVTDPGTGLELSAPLKFAHAANMPFSVAGTGISFEPATTVAHSSNEPVQPLGTGLTLDRPLERDHAIDAVVRDAAVTTAGYQGSAAPDQWFGGPALSPAAGAMVLRDAAGLVVDSLNYGGLVDPWAAEGYQAMSGAIQGGSRAPSPGVAGPGPGGGSGVVAAYRSSGRYPDGADTDNNGSDFWLQADTTLPVAVAAGATNVKVTSVANFAPGQSVIVDTGETGEAAVIASVGTAGGTTASAALEAGATRIALANAAGFSAGQAVTIDTGNDLETAVVASVAGAGRRAPGGPSITLVAPLKSAHAAGAQVSGTGITFTTTLKQAHRSGAPLASDVPTPGAPNRYAARAQ